MDIVAHECVKIVREGLVRRGTRRAEFKRRTERESLMLQSVDAFMLSIMMGISREDKATDREGPASEGQPRSLVSRPATPAPSKSVSWEPIGQYRCGI
ncbi:hypothetical protein EVAR_19192_1 [Eumeta japonica]|uniref:Uncharacterized protein n=1 Tax=Eumeta variegata TaxID=151549 RepID=A0A4C1VEM5_EUMVA|nr:hypothetical protein EVAR_19192_1 [Eumeta japonica]